MRRNYKRALVWLAIGAYLVATPTFAAGLTESQIQAIVGLLQSFGADASVVQNVNASLHGTSPATPPGSSASATAQCAYAWARDLEVGSAGLDVKALQQFLNGNGATIATTGVGSVGHESTYFGVATKAALAKYQSAHGLSGTGYFGALTRAKIGFLCASAGSGGTSTSVSVSSSGSSGGTFVERAQGPVTSSGTVTVTSTGSATSSSPTCSLAIGFAQTSQAGATSSSLELIWSSKNTTSGSIFPSIGAVATSGIIGIAPTTTTLYSATFTGPNGAASCNATVNVN